MCLNVVGGVVMHVGNIICQTMQNEILGNLKGAPWKSTQTCYATKHRDAYPGHGTSKFFIKYTV